MFFNQKPNPLISKMQPFSPHDRFFSSLKQVEARLTSEGINSSIPKNPLQDHINSSPDQLTSPIYLDYPILHNNNNNNTSSSRSPPLPDSSGPAQEFLSNSPLNLNPSPLSPEKVEDEDDEGDDIERLIGMLGLFEEGGGEGVLDSCHCSGGGFYSKVAEVKGPKCEKEMKRLDGWIDYFCSGAEKKEPVRLAHLLLGKAVCLGGVDDDFEGTGFPSTVEEFLEHDSPPSAS